MANEKREKITMEELRNSGDELLYLDLMLNEIRCLTDRIEYWKSVLTDDSSCMRKYFRKITYREYKRRTVLFDELCTNYLIRNIDDDVRKYINDRLEGIY